MGGFQASGRIAEKLERRGRCNARLRPNNPPTYPVSMVIVHIREKCDSHQAGVLEIGAEFLGSAPLNQTILRHQRGSS